MGKVRAKQRKKSGRRPRPTGLPSVKETEEDMSLEPAPQPGIPVLEKLKAVSPSERLWACHSLLHLLEQKSHQVKLVGAGLVARLLPLLLDGELEVRGAAASVLSKLSGTDDGSLLHQLTSHPCLSHLAAMLQQGRDRLTSCSHGNPAETGGTVSGQEEAGPGEVGVGEREQEEALGMECEDVEERKKMKKKKSKRKAQERARQEKQRVQMTQSIDSICLGLQLLGNICERSPSVLEESYTDGSSLLVHTVLDMMVPLYPHPEVSIAAAQVLLTVLEDTSSTAVICVEHVPVIMASLKQCSERSGLLWHASASAAGNANTLPDNTLEPRSISYIFLLGVLYYLLPHMKEESTSKQEVLQVVMATYSSLLDACLASDMADKDCHRLIEASVAAMEIITNMAYTEDNGSDDQDSLELEEEEEEVTQEEDGHEATSCEGMEVESQSSEIKESRVMEDSLLSSIVQMDLHNKVLKIVDALLTNTSISDDGEQSSGEADGCRKSLLASSLCAFQNLVSSVPLVSWCGGCARLVSLWTRLLDRLDESCDPAAVSGVMVTLLHTLIKEDQQCVSCKELEAVGRISLTSDLSAVRTDMVSIVGLVGKHQLQKSQVNGGTGEVLTMVGGILKECVAKEQCLPVVCHALDSIFDIFGDDGCPVELFTSLDLLPVLMECRASFNARYKVERKQFQSQLSVVQMVRTNLPRFINYMKTRIT